MLKSTATADKLDAKDKTAVPELLAPAGSPAALAAALRAGADAVYVGTKGFNARMNAANFDAAEIGRAVRDCHAAGARLYAALNTLVLEREYKAALETARMLWLSGADALIVADLGLARELKLNFPDFELHASTQAGVHSADGARELAGLGISRVVAARELKKKDIEAVAASGVETEIFVHGALCVCHSGQCLFSSLVGGRSGNRGECAQPCRLNYNGAERYPLSLKDCCLAGHLDEILDTGVASLKIEGRMKNPDYVYAVTANWRILLDERRGATPREIGDMARVFSRGGFTDGYFTGVLDCTMNGVRSAEDKMRTAAAVKGAERRSAAAVLKTAPVQTPERADAVPAIHPANAGGKEKETYLTARFYDPSAVPEKHGFRIVYLPADKFDPNKANGVMIPPVVPDSERRRVLNSLKKARSAGAEYALIANIGHFALAREAGFTHLRCDFRMGAYSAQTARVLFDLGAEAVMFSPELTVPQLRDIDAPTGAVVYGRVPLMLLEKKLDARRLIDRRNYCFPVITEGGRDIVLNSTVTYMSDRKAELDRAGISERHFIFTVESRTEAVAVTAGYKRGAPPRSNNVRRIK